MHTKINFAMNLIFLVTMHRNDGGCQSFGSEGSKTPLNLVGDTSRSDAIINQASKLSWCGFDVGHDD